MNAVEVVMMARTAGIELTIDGDSLQLSAASEPPLSVIEELRRHKLEIVNLLRSNDQRFEEPPHSEPYGEIIAKLRSRCPDQIERDRWQHAIQDGDSFLARWGGQAQALGWTAHELFGLHAVPARPAPTYSRLSRYDETGLIWLLRGRPVVALTEATAVIQGATGRLVYRKQNKLHWGRSAIPSTIWGHAHEPTPRNCRLLAASNVCRTCCSLLRRTLRRGFHASRGA